MVDQNDFLKAEGGKTADELFEEIQQDAGMQAIEKVASAHIDQLVDIRENYAVDDLDLLSSNVKKISNVPEDVRQKVASFQSRVRMIIEKVAVQIEERKYKTTEQAVAAMRLSVTERSRVEALIQADKKLFVSYESLKTTVELLTKMNDVIIQKIAESEKSGDVGAERGLFLGNAVLIYELTDYVIQYVEHFQLQGIADIEQIRSSELKKLEQESNHQRALKSRAKSMSMPELRDGIIASIDALEGSIELIRKEWDNYTSELKTIQAGISPMSKKLKDIQVLRDLAKLQIKTYQLAVTVGILKKNNLALEDALKGLANLRLVSLTPDRVRRLFLLGENPPAPSLPNPASSPSNPTKES